MRECEGIRSICVRSGDRTNSAKAEDRGGRANFALAAETALDGLACFRQKKPILTPSAALASAGKANDAATALFKFSPQASMSVIVAVTMERRTNK
jgi:hypothetical protein